MIDKKYTDKDIISSLEVIATTCNCNECKIRSGKWGTCNCSETTANAALGLINRQQDEIDSLREHLKRVCAERDARICTNNFIKSEAVKEFANRLKNKIKTECNPYGKPTFDYDTSIAIMHYIDKLISDEVWRNW